MPDLREKYGSGNKRRHKVVTLVSVVAIMGGGYLGEASPLVVAHRGARSLAPENTLAAARVAWELGADMWEFDVQLTKDGEIVLMHDDTLSRTTNAEELFPDRRPWRVADFTLAEIKRLDAGSWFLVQDPFGTLALGEVPPQRQNFKGEPVPTLREALLFSREHGLRVNIELKAGYFWLGRRQKELAEKVVARVRELGMEGQAILSSFNHDLVRYLGELAPKITIAPIYQWLFSDPLADLERMGARAISLALSAFNPKTCQALWEAGIQVYVWTVNEPEDLARLQGEGCLAGILSDYPQRLVTDQRAVPK